MKAQSATFGFVRLATLVAALLALFSLLGCVEENDTPVPADEEAAGLLPPVDSISSAFALAGGMGKSNAQGKGKTCHPMCRKLQCGDDGCGGSCGTCSDTAVCEQGLCLSCSTPPISCDDGDACTADSSVPGADVCMPGCSNVPITACDGGDGCCPAGCAALGDSDCSATCGNGVVEAGETCDPAGSCPTSCGSGNACATATLTGSAATCDVECVYDTVATCTSGDGCCPSNCDANGDSDCPAACGNGVKEPGETCDPMSTCPAFCDDANACTRDILQGSPQTCDSVCSYASVTSCTSGDGCCPAGCTTSLDSDCAAVCGNGVLESGETCDPAGSCPTACNDGGACTVGTLLGSASSCTAVCSYSAVSACQNNDGCCPAGCGSSNDNDCTLDCHDASTWPAAWVAYEDEVLALVNSHRAAGTDCSTTVQQPVAPLVAEARLREAARCHSMDMAVNSYFSHTGSDGSMVTDRFYAVGYPFVAAGENIAAGQASPSVVVRAWMLSPGHCKNIMNGTYEDLGVGYYYDATSSPYFHYWTQDFGKQP